MSADNRTEKATPKKREDARKKGQVARSVEVNTVFVLLAALGVLFATGPAMLNGFLQVVRDGLELSAQPSRASEDGLGDLARWVGLSTLRLVAPVMIAAAVAGVLATVIQVKPRFTPSVVKPKFSKLNPLPGFKRLFGKQALFEGAKAVVKTGVVGTAAFLAVWPSLPELAATVGMPPGAILLHVCDLILGIVFRAGIALALIAVVDFLWQRRRHENDLKMSKEEVKQEHRQQDVAPEVRAAIRRRQFQQARKRMMAEVPTADVVVTNPTHFAVALRYDGSKPAPEVIAKGADLIAAQIRTIAREHGVPVLENPPLARALYREVEIGHQIPEAFFQAVAEILAFVFRTAWRRVATAA
jgi:flagellar biosynthetic protein FlhB